MLVTKWSYDCEVDDQEVDLIVDPSDLMHLPRHCDQQICAIGQVPSQKVQRAVNFSRKKFIGTVVENNLLPPGPAPLLSVSEGIRSGYRKPGLLRLKIRSIANLCKCFETRKKNYLHPRGDWNPQCFKIRICEALREPDCMLQAKPNETPNLTYIRVCTSMGCTMTLADLSGKQAFD